MSSDEDIDFGSSDSDFVVKKKIAPAQKKKKLDTSSSRSAKKTVSGSTNSDDETSRSPVDPTVAQYLPPAYIVELAKSGRAECKRCGNLITNKSLRIGILVESDWGLITRWQHLQCTVFHKAITSANVIDGFSELDKDSQNLVNSRVLNSQSETDQDDCPVQPDELVRACWTEAAVAPPDILVPLLPYQQEGLGWMIHQENNDVHGGILADEMGMGKTIEAISLILSNRPPAVATKEWKESDERHNFSLTKGHFRGKTLVVVPTIAIRQWQAEILRFCRVGSLSVFVYHGDNRGQDMRSVSEADIVLTTYKIMEIEYRKAHAGTKVECSICGRKFYPEKLRIHRKYFCGESAQRTDAQAKTQKKKGASRTVGGSLEDSSDDEISKQKKDIKKGKQNVLPSKKRVRVKSDSEEEDEEDDIDKQKKAIKAATNARSVKGSVGGRRAPAVVSKKGSLSSQTSIKRSVPISSSDSDDDEDVYNQKRVTKQASKFKNKKPDVAVNSKDQAASSKMRDNSSSDRSKNIVSNGRAMKSDSSKMKRSTKNVSVSSSSESNYSSSAVSSGGSDEYDSDFKPNKKSRSHQGGIKSNKQAVSKTSTSSRSKPSKSSGKSNADVGIDSDVEAEIRRALASQSRAKKQATLTSFLHNMSWFRVILGNLSIFILD